MDDILERLDKAFDELFEAESCKTTNVKGNKARRALNAMTNNDKKADMAAKIVDKATKP